MKIFQYIVCVSWGDLTGRRLPLLMALLVVTSLSCSFKETVPATYQCSAEQPTCPEGMECRGDQCVPVGASVDLVSRPADGGSEGRATDGGDGRITGDLSETCTPQETLPCTTELLGLCAPGQRTCDGEGAWGPCEPLVQPVEEILRQQPGRRLRRREGQPGSRLPGLHPRRHPGRLHLGGARDLRAG